MLNLKNVFAAAALTLVTMGTANAGATKLDGFDYTLDMNGDGILTGDSAVNSEMDTIFDINSANGDVDYKLTWSAGSPNLNQNATANTYDLGIPQLLDLNNDGVLSYNNDGFVSSMLEITYSDFNQNGFGPLDLEVLGTGFYFDVLSSDQGFGVQLTVGSNNGADVSQYSSVSGQVSSLTRSVVGFNEFSTVLGAGADFASVDFVKIVLSAAAGFDSLDLTLTEFGVVPAPTTLAIFGLGLLGLGAARRRKA